MKKLTQERADKLKAEGITHIASIVKWYKATKYFGVASIEDILANGGVRPKNARYCDMACERGDLESEIDWAKTIRWGDI